MDVIRERLERHFNIPVIVTAPSVKYKVILRGYEKAKESEKEKYILYIDNPSQMPEVSKILHIEEPYIKATIITPEEYVGPIMELCQNRRGELKKFEYIGEGVQQRVCLEYEMPMAEILFDFFDKLKSISKGYASFDYEHIGYRKSDLVKLDVYINKKLVDALSIIVHRTKAYERARNLVEKLKEVIPRQLFEVSIQAGIGSKIIASERIPPLKANVLAKCYGGDVTRKKKLLEKQKEGKKKLKMIGKVEIPQEAFLSVLKVD